MEVKELVSRCVAGESSAWDEFVRQYETHLYRNVLSKIYSIGAYSLLDEAEDIVQEIFISLWEKNKLSRLRDVECLKAWLSRVAINVTRNYCKKMFKVASKTKSLYGKLSDSGLTLEAGIPCDKCNTEKAIDNAEFDDFLRKEINKLALKKRQAFKLFIYDCANQGEVGVIMDIPKSTASTLIRRAKAQVWEAIEKYA